MLAINLAQQLISCPSLTPDEAGCHALLTEQLLQANFTVESMRFKNVDNLWAKLGDKRPLLVFAGHSDVVAPGDLTKWRFPPFSAVAENGYLFGRGAVDMKGSLAAMVAAVQQFLQHHANFAGSIGFLITSDEEGEAINGTHQVLNTLKKRGEIIDYCIVGEPSSANVVGDQIRIGRRGSLHGTVTIYGEQRHIAYPRVNANPLHTCLGAFLELATKQNWDDDYPVSEQISSTIWQMSNIQSNSSSLNVTPDQVKINFNFRFSNRVTPERLQAQVLECLAAYNLNFSCAWQLASMPWLSKAGALLTSVQDAIFQLRGQIAQLSTGGGTSDGRFFADYGAEVIELGLLNEHAHKIDECVKTADILFLQNIYQTILTKLFSTSQ